MQLVVPSAVRNAVSAATITFTASSMILCFFMVRFSFSRNEEGGMRKEITRKSNYPLPPSPELSAVGANT